MRLILILLGVFVFPGFALLAFLGGVGTLAARTPVEGVERRSLGLWLLVRLWQLQLLAGVSIMLGIGAWSLLTYWLPCLYW